jgi:hypothetical protein
MTIFGAFVLGTALLVGSGMGLFTSLAICRAENRERYPATCPAVDQHPALLGFGLVLGPTALVVLLGIARARVRTIIIVAGVTLGFWAGYVISLVVT